MYTPPAFSVADRQSIFAIMHGCGLASLITAGPDGPIVTPLPMFLDEAEGDLGTLYGHIARANPHWNTTIIGEALALFMGPDAYISPSWYASKAEHGKVVPTWNYQAVEARGPLEFFDEPTRLRGLVGKLTDLHEAKQTKAWRIDDAPEKFIEMQLRAIVGIRIPITSLAGKSKMSQNRHQADRAGVIKGLSASPNERDHAVSDLISLGKQ